MIRLLDRNAVVLHVPKTGGTSVRYALDPYAGEPSTPLPPKTVKVPDDWVEKTHRLSQHASAAATIALYPELYGARFYAFVRNPWARYVSAYRFFRERGRAPYAKMSFSAFVEFGWEFRPQISYLDGAEKATILSFERLQEGVDRICDENALGRVKLPHYKRNAEVDYRRWYSDRGRERIANLCAVDIKRMGYEF